MRICRDISEQLFGRLTALRKVSTSGLSKWECRCSCGTIHVVRESHLISGAINSCGCLIKERNAKRQIAQGTRFGSLTVICWDSSIDGRSLYKCLCDCGNIKIIRGHSLVCKLTKTCGQCTEAIKVGMVFERLLVLSKGGLTKGKNRYWLCRCSCGSETQVISDNLLSGHTKSCGCLVKEFLSDRWRQYRIENGYDPDVLLNALKTEREIEYFPVRRFVLARDKYQCRICNALDNLQTHHIFPKRVFPELRNNASFIITLCKKCHNSVHGNNYFSDLDPFDQIYLISINR